MDSMLDLYLRDIYEHLCLADRLCLRKSSRRFAALPVTCEMTWNYKQKHHDHLF